MQDKKISIIIPVKNNENEIENCVKELIKIKNVNNFRNFEILFVDDFSNDNSWNVIIRETYKFSKLVKGIKLKRNL
jgi:glycosyltransferase involved in cell wall biosynthesis